MTRATCSTGEHYICLHRAGLHPSSCTRSKKANSGEGKTLMCKGINAQKSRVSSEASWWARPRCIGMLPGCKRVLATVERAFMNHSFGLLQVTAHSLRALPPPPPPHMHAWLVARPPQPRDAASPGALPENLVLGTTLRKNARRWGRSHVWQSSDKAEQNSSPLPLLDFNPCFSKSNQSMS